MSAVLTPQAPATPSNPLGLPLQALQAGLRRFTVAEYRAMIRPDILPEKPGVVLIEGYLVNTMTQNGPHVAGVNRVRKRLDRVLPAGWNSISQAPIILADSVPEPDYVATRATDAEIAAGGPPGPPTIGLVVEVADSSLAVDRTDQQRIYARAGLPVYWIVNIPDRQVEVYTTPQPTATPPGYATRTDYRAGDAVPLVLDGVPVAAVPVADVLPAGRGHGGQVGLAISPDGPEEPGARVTNAEFPQ